MLPLYYHKLGAQVCVLEFLGRWRWRVNRWESFSFGYRFMATDPVFVSSGKAIHDVKEKLVIGKHEEVNQLRALIPTLHWWKEDREKIFTLQESFPTILVSRFGVWLCLLASFRFVLVVPFLSRNKRDRHGKVRDRLPFRHAISVFLLVFWLTSCLLVF